MLDAILTRKKRITRIIVTAVCIMTALSFMPCVNGADQAQAATKKMTVYTQAVKSGNTVYCSSVSGLNKVNLKSGKVKLLLPVDDPGYSWYTCMKKNGSYIYFLHDGSSSKNNLGRINTKTGKGKSLTSGQNFTRVTNYAIHKGRIFVRGYWDGDSGKKHNRHYIKRSMKLNGKDKKHTTVKAKMTKKRSNSRGYRVVEEISSSNGKHYYVQSWLDAPKGKSYYLGETKIDLMAYQKMRESRRWNAE